MRRGSFLMELATLKQSYIKVARLVAGVVPTDRRAERTDIVLPPLAHVLLYATNLLKWFIRVWVSGE